MQKTTKARDKPDGSKSATVSQSSLSVVMFALQASQRIAQWVVLLFVLHVLSSQVALIVRPALQEPLTALMDSCKIVYQMTIGAYFTKAAVENVLKIQKSLKSAETYAASADGEEGNG